jgi:hypothetical protein
MVCIWRGKENKIWREEGARTNKAANQIRRRQEEGITEKKKRRREENGIQHKYRQCYQTPWQEEGEVAQVQAQVQAQGLEQV